MAFEPTFIDFPADTNTKIKTYSTRDTIANFEITAFRLYGIIPQYRNRK